MAKKEAGFEEKITEAAELIRKAATQLENCGLTLDFQIIIKPQPETVSLTIESSGKTPVSK
jgi:hypothetical protein